MQMTLFGGKNVYIKLIFLSDVYHGRGNGGESIYGPVFEGKYLKSPSLA